MPNHYYRLRGLTMLALSALLSRAVAQQQFTGQAFGLTTSGTTRLGALGPVGAPIGAPDDLLAKTRPELSTKLQGAARLARPSAAHGPGLKTPRPNASQVANAGPKVSGFPGLSQLDQRTAGTGIYVDTQFTVEPPDVPLAVGNGYVLAAVNAALAVYDTAGNLLSGPVPLNQFFGLPPEVIRGTTPVFGDSTTDPRCLYDADSGRWFVSVSRTGMDPVTADFLDDCSVLIAVSKTGDPRGDYNIYTIPVSGAQADLPLIGVNANALIVTFDLFSSLSLPSIDFYGSVVVAIQKSEMLVGGTASGGLFGPITFDEGPVATIQPASAPPGSRRGKGNDDVHYFLSSMDFDGTLDNRIAVWALTGLRSLNQAKLKLTLNATVIPTQVYGMPPAAEQKPGSIPLGDLVGEPLAWIESNDDRMNQVVYVDGTLYGAVNTVVGDRKGPDRAGIAYFAVEPKWDGKKLKPELRAQGYVAAAGNHVLFPAIALNREGKGLIAFSLVGQDYYPSVAYVDFSGQKTSGPIRLVAAGAGPEDGFSGYQAFGGEGIARWGDYSTATVDEDGSIWFAAEFIPGGSRTTLANWGTFIGRLSP